MKINLESPQPRNGYWNINFGMPQQIDKSVADNLNSDSRMIMGDFRNLSTIIEDSSAEEIIFNPPVNYITPDDLVKVLDHWKQKLSIGGILKLFYIDINRIANGITTGELNLQDAHNLIYGNNNQHKSLMDTNIFRVVAEKMGFQIETICPQQYFVSIELTKNI